MISRSIFQASQVKLHLLSHAEGTSRYTWKYEVYNGNLAITAAQAHGLRQTQKQIICKLHVMFL